MNSIQIHQATSSSNLAKGTNKNHTNVSPKIITHLPKKSQVSFGTLMYISSPRVSLTTPCFFVIFRGKKTQGAPVFSRKKGPINGPENQAPRHLCWCFFNILVVRATGIGVLTEKKRTTASNTNGWIFSRMRKFPKKILNFWRAFKQILFFLVGDILPYEGNHHMDLGWLGTLQCVMYLGSFLELMTYYIKDISQLPKVLKRSMYHHQVTVLIFGRLHLESHEIDWLMVLKKNPEDFGCLDKGCFCTAGVKWTDTGFIILNEYSLCRRTPFFLAFFL